MPEHSDAMDIDVCTPHPQKKAIWSNGVTSIHPRIPASQGFYTEVKHPLILYRCLIFLQHLQYISKNTTFPINYLVLDSKRKLNLIIQRQLSMNNASVVHTQLYPAVPNVFSMDYIQDNLCLVHDTPASSRGRSHFQLIHMTYFTISI